MTLDQNYFISRNSMSHKRGKRKDSTRCEFVVSNKPVKKLSTDSLSWGVAGFRQNNAKNRERQKREMIGVTTFNARQAKSIAKQIF